MFPELKTIQQVRSQANSAATVGPYQLRALLGSGGMGEVYLAEHRLLKRPCALKRIRADRSRDPDAIARFEGEAQAMGRLTHPNTVEIYDYGTTDEGEFYYVMEFLPGLSLQDPADLTITREGLVLGSPLFAAPELAFGEREVDHRADIYSLGATAYFLLTGRPVFAGESPLRVALAHAQQTPAPLFGIPQRRPGGAGGDCAQMPGQVPRGPLRLRRGTGGGARRLCVRAPLGPGASRTLVA